MDARINRTVEAAFLALSDPTRRAILRRLAHGEATGMALVKPFRMTQPAVSQHLKVLERAGLIARRVDGARRPCRLSAAGIDCVDRWIGLPIPWRYDFLASTT